MISPYRGPKRIRAFPFDGVALPLQAYEVKQFRSIILNLREVSIMAMSDNMTTGLTGIIRF